MFTRVQPIYLNSQHIWYDVEHSNALCSMKYMYNSFYFNSKVQIFIHQCHSVHGIKYHCNSKDLREPIYIL